MYNCLHTHCCHGFALWRRGLSLSSSSVVLRHQFTWLQHGERMHEKIGKLKLGFSKTYFTIDFGKMLKIIFHDYKIRNLFVSYYVCFSCFLFFFCMLDTHFFSASGLTNQSQSRTQEVDWNWPISQKGCTRYEPSCKGITLGNRRIRKIDCRQANEGKKSSNIFDKMCVLLRNWYWKYPYVFHFSKIVYHMLKFSSFCCSNNISFLETLLCMRNK